MATFRDAYINDSPDVLKLYAKSLKDLLTLPLETRPWDAELVTAIREFNADLGNPIELDGTEAVIITGQQPGNFTGPLYSVYKAITTIRLAEKLAEQHGAPCLPVFWVGSEDHDFDEAAKVYFPSKKHVTHSLTLEQAPEQAGNAMHQVDLTEQVHELIDFLGESAPSGEFHDEILAFLHDSARDASSLSDWSTRGLARLFRDTPLIFFAPHLVAARRASAHIMKQAITAPLETSKSVNDGAEAIEALGYTAQVVKNDDECAFFLDVNSHRHKITYDGSHFCLPDAGRTFTKGELLAILKETPERFSPNVALRCVVQQGLFPVAAYVAGPGELTYWGQFKGVFELFGVSMPVVYPRAQAVLTTIKVNKLLNKYSLGVSELTGTKDALVEKALSSVTKSPALDHARSQRVLLSKTLSDLATGLEKDAPVAAAMATTLSAELKRKLDRLESVILQSDTQKYATVTGHIERLCECLAPRRKPQERMHTVYAYLFEHGWGIMDTLLREIEIESFEMNEVEL